MNSFSKVGVVLICFMALVACNKKDSEASSTVGAESAAEQVGDVMASIDEFGGSNGAYALMSDEARVLARTEPLGGAKFESRMMALALPQASAASCFVTNTWGSCTSNVITRNFQGCTVGGATFTGSVTLTFADGNTNNVCTIASDGHSITRSPSFTITGTRGGQFSVSKTGTDGQKLTRTGVGAFAFSSDGIRRQLSYNGTTLSDFTALTTADIGVTSSARNGRVVNGGTLRVTNNLSNEVCDFTPSNVTWTNTCNCPVSGSWSATCGSDSGSLAITGCGTGTYTVGGVAKSVTFDRCSSL